ncbi:unnamed protein product [Ectocarpus sp. 13 AM-2016]
MMVTIFGPLCLLRMHERIENQVAGSLFMCQPAAIRWAPDYYTSRFMPCLIHFISRGGGSVARSYRFVAR